MASSPSLAAPSSEPIRIANCSGALSHGVTEATMAGSAVQRAQLNGPGWIQTALDRIQLSLDLTNEKRIKVVINGGAMKPKGLAERIYKMLSLKGYKLHVGYVEGDNLMHKAHHLLSNSLTHFDGANPKVYYKKDAASFLDSPKDTPILAANAYLGYRAIKRGPD
nr:duf1446 domain containing protein [Trichoderma decipiens]